MDNLSNIWLLGKLLLKDQKMLWCPSYEGKYVMVNCSYGGSMSYVRSVDTVLTHSLIYPTSVLRRSMLVCLICGILGRYHIIYWLSSTCDVVWLMHTNWTLLTDT